MTRVDFHFNAPDKIGYGCRLIRKAFRAGQRLVVFSDDAAQLAEFDRELWSFSALDFIPHVMASSPLAAETPIILTHTETLPDDRPLMINLGRVMPPGFARFERLIEVVTADDADREQGRARWKFYRDRGYPIGTHDLAAPARPGRTD